MTIPSNDELTLLHNNICQALGDPKRIQILYALNEEPRHVSALAVVLDTPQPTISRHLRVLRQRTLVLTERDGPAVYYRLANPKIIEILDEMRSLLRDSLDRQSSILQ
jgi:ArsR family transcriptional regulator